MSRGHGLIVNYSSWMPFVFTYNPEEVDTNKNINYVVAPNIGGAFKKRFFSGFDSKEVSFQLVCIDMEDPLGVKEEIAFFDQLRQPDPGLFGIATSFFGNENYPPPQVLFQFGVAFMPLVWDVLSVSIKEDLFRDGHISGVIGIPKRATIDITLSLVEDHPLNKANQIAQKAEYIAGSVESMTKEVFHKINNSRKEQAGLFPPVKGSMW